MQIEPKGAAAARLGVDADSASHALSRFFHDGQSDPGPLIIFTQTLENTENLFLRLLWDPYAVVLNEKPYHALMSSQLCAARNVQGWIGALGPDAHARMLSWRHEFHCVSKQVGEALRDRCRVPKHSRQAAFNQDLGRRSLQIREGLDNAPR